HQRQVQRLRILVRQRGKERLLALRRMLQLELQRLPAHPRVRVLPEGGRRESGRKCRQVVQQAQQVPHHVPALIVQPRQERGQHRLTHLAQAIEQCPAHGTYVRRRERVEQRSRSCRADHL